MTERIEFTCMDCGKEVDREPVSMDIEGLTPKRCVQCTMQAMKESVKQQHK